MPTYTRRHETTSPTLPRALRPALCFDTGVNEYDFVVIGGGSAGYAGARTAAAHGLRTLVVEGGREVGGLCILRGCMPSKTLLESSRRFDVLRRAEEFGLSAASIGFSLPAIISRKRALVEEFASYRRGQLTDGRFEFLRGNAEFVDAQTLEVRTESGEPVRVRGRTFLWSTGSHASTPPVPGLAAAALLTSDEMLALETLPDSLVVLGGGAIALEMATFAHSLGARVTIIQRSPQLLRGTDHDAATVLADAMRLKGIELFTDTELLEVRRDNSGLTVQFRHDGHIVERTAAEGLNALGRHAATEGLEKTGVVAGFGTLLVTPDQRTSQPHIFAAGDVCGPLEVVHVAIQQGEVAARNAARHLGRLGGEPERMDYRLKLFAVFSDPQFATVGATEAELTAAGIPFRTASYPFADHGKSLVMGETHGIVKLTAHAASGEILGGSVVGPEASELIHEIAVAMHFRATAATLASIPHYHPTLSEIWTYPAEELAEAQD